MDWWLDEGLKISIEEWIVKMDGWVYGLWIDGGLNGWVDLLVDRWINRGMDRWIDEGLPVPIVEWIGWMDGWMGKRIGGYIED
jgi:hypothetical protein